MGNELINFDEEFKKLAMEFQQTLVPARGNYLSLRGKVFTLPDATTSQTIDCVVLDFVRINALLPQWQPNVRGVAKCWAMGYDDKNMIPSDRSPTKQHDTCTGCPHDKFGSSASGRGKSCTNRYRLAVVPPDATIESDIWLLNVPPTSLVRWRDYVRALDMKLGPASFMKVITNLTFDPNVTYPSLFFKAVRPLDDPELILSLHRRGREANLVEPSAD